MEFSCSQWRACEHAFYKYYLLCWQLFTVIMSSIYFRETTKNAQYWHKMRIFISSLVENCKYSQCSRCEMIVTDVLKQTLFDTTPAYKLLASRPCITMQPLCIPSLNTNLLTFCYGFLTDWTKKKMQHRFLWLVIKYEFMELVHRY